MWKNYCLRDRHHGVYIGLEPLGEDPAVDILVLEHLGEVPVQGEVVHRGFVAVDLGLLHARPRRLVRKADLERLALGLLFVELKRVEEGLVVDPGNRDVVLLLVAVEDETGVMRVLLFVLEVFDELEIELEKASELQGVWVCQRSDRDLELRVLSQRS
jgi:hypothetical protein